MTVIEACLIMFSANGISILVVPIIIVSIIVSLSVYYQFRAVCDNKYIFMVVTLFSLLTGACGFYLAMGRSIYMMIAIFSFIYQGVYVLFDLICTVCIHSGRRKNGRQIKYTEIYFIASVIILSGIHYLGHCAEHNENTRWLAVIVLVVITPLVYVLLRAYSKNIFRYILVSLGAIIILSGVFWLLTESDQVSAYINRKWIEFSATADTILIIPIALDLICYLIYRAVYRAVKHQPPQAEQAATDEATDEETDEETE